MAPWAFDMHNPGCPLGKAMLKCAVQSAWCIQKSRKMVTKELFLLLELLHYLDGVYEVLTACQFLC